MFRFELRDLDDIEPWGSPETGLTLHWFGLTDGWYDMKLFGRGVDYYVARLWEDLIELAPRALERIPQPLATRLADIDVDELAPAALDWWWQRAMNTSYLAGAPRLHLWRDADVLRCHGEHGEAIVNPDAFRDALIAFDRELIAAMDARVSAIERSWSRPEITIDIEALRREHTDRSAWLGTALRHREHDWDDVIAAVVELERRIGPVG